MAGPNVNAATVEVAALTCPHSGAPVWHCQLTRLCGCDDYPEIADAIEAALDERAERR